MPEIRNSVRKARIKRGLSAAALARQAGISRQTIYAVEDGSYIPNTAIALRLARIFDVSVEELFTLESEIEKPVRAEILGESDGLVRLCTVGKKVIAVPAGRSTAYLPWADGIAAAGMVTPFENLRDDGKRMVIAGCDPALSQLAEMASEAGFQVITASCSSRTALQWLKQGRVHAAGSHLLHAKTGVYNVPIVKELLGRRAAKIVTFAAWEQGFVVMKGNPKQIRSFADLGRTDVTIVNREKGSGSRDLLDAGLQSANIACEKVSGYAVLAAGHLQAATRVAKGKADCCVANRAAARYFDLDFIPLALERFDLTFSAEAIDMPVARAVLERLNRAPFRRKLHEYAGYDTAHTGDTLF